MDLHSGNPYWMLKNGFITAYPSLKKNLKCDVAIIGGGITGALVAYHLQQTGAKIVIVDSKHIASGSTSASTALLQYEIDTSLKTLINKFGRKNADECYLLFLDAIYQLEKIANKLPVDCNFEFKKSLYLASAVKDIQHLNEELIERNRIGINVKMLNPQQIKNIVGFEAPAALYSKDAAQMNPLVFTYGLYEYLSHKGVNIFDLTEIVQIKETKSSAILKCTNGYSISCKKFVFATGYASQLYINKKIAKLNSTYVIISKPLHKQQLKLLKPLIWETARPYLYIRSTADNRVIIGGKDEKFYTPLKRDILINKKAIELQKAFIKKFPTIPFETDYAWAGTFAETKDGLPYIGINEQYKHAYFALGFGGNGIVFSEVAGKIIKELFLTGESDNAHLFSFSR